MYQVHFLNWTQNFGRNHTSRRISIYVHYREVVLGCKIERIHKKNKCIPVSKDESFIYVPFLNSLAQLFSNKRIAKLIFRKPNYSDADIFYDICDGEFFKDDRLFKEHDDALAIIIYHDALEVCNPLWQSCWNT